MILAFLMSAFLTGQTLAPQPAAKPVEGSKALQLVGTAAPQSATQFVLDSVIELEKVVDGIKNSTGKAKAEKEAELRRILSTKLDLSRLGQRALISHWDELGKTAKTRAQRERYMKLFRQLIEENYMEQARKYIGGDYVMTLTGEEKGPEGLTKVNGRIKKPDVDVIVEFHVVKAAPSWRISDIQLDATSLEATYRSSFNRIIRKKGGLNQGFPELLSTMDKRLAELKKGKATKF